VHITERWELLWSSLKKVFDDRNEPTFLHPELFVHLLYDQASFPRSRFYFWAIGCLSTFEENVAINVRNLRTFQKDMTAVTASKAHRKQVKILIAKVEMHCRKLEEIGLQLQKRLATVQALRDGVRDLMHTSTLFTELIT
jgi:hypothetical protein